MRPFWRGPSVTTALRPVRAPRLPSPRRLLTTDIRSRASSRPSLGSTFFTSKQLPTRRFASDHQHPQRRKPLRIGRLIYRTSLFLGSSVLIVGIAIVGFFIYDASTYKEESTSGDVSVSLLALNPQRGGPKNLPIIEDYIDDYDTDEHKALKGKPRLVILGGGWGSVAMLKNLNPGDYHVTVVSPTNYFLFTPMLPSATVGTIEVRSLVEPIRRILSRTSGNYVRARAEDVDFSNKLVEVSQESEDGKQTRFYVPYDKLIIGVGCQSNPHGVPGLEHAFLLKNVRDARRIRNKIQYNFELACLPTTSDEERKRLLSFVICGGGPTGVEFAAELYDFLNEDFTRQFPKLLRNEISVHLIQSRSHILNTYDEQVSRYTEERFARDNVNVLTNARVKEVRPESIMFSQRDDKGNMVTKEIPTGFCLWSTGIAQRDFSKRLVDKLGSAQTNRMALETDTHLRLNGAPLGNVYAIGDCATVQNNIADHVVSFLRTLSWKHGKNPEKLQIGFEEWRSVASEVKKKFPQAISHLKRVDRLFEEFDKDRSGTLDFEELSELLAEIDSRLTSLPATAQRANQQGQYLAYKFNKMARASPDMIATGVTQGDLDSAVYKAFEYRHLGNLAYVGNSAVFDLGEGWNLIGGLWAVYAWRSVYFAQSVSLRTRILMAMDWAKRGLFGRDIISY